MPAIIAQIIALLIPILVEWIRKWIESRLLKASDGMQMGTFASEDDARDEMFDRAIANLPHLAFFRRSLFKGVKKLARDCGVTSKGCNRQPTKAELLHVAGLAETASDE